ncbi:MAG: hypothetical protein KDE27_28315, partial [Planctomycetes bacterium]|nr:hypothetical protein [Planctomycetota bacterium]
EPPAAEPEPRPEPPARLQVRAVARSPVLEPVPVGDWPTLAAAVPTTAPLDAQVLLVAGEQGWPLLCFGNRGLGRVGAFAADLCGDAGAEFRRDPEFPARLALWVQDVLRAEPVFEPAVLALAPRVEPRAPTPAEIAALEGLGGAAMQREAAPPSPAIAREVRSLVPEWAFGALALVVLLALAERFAVLRGKLV